MQTIIRCKCEDEAATTDMPFTFHFRAWVPTPRGFIDIKQKLSELNFRLYKKIRNFDEADSYLSKFFNVFSSYRVIVRVREVEYDSNRHFSKIKGDVQYEPPAQIQKIFDVAFVSIALPIFFGIFVCFGFLPIATIDHVGIFGFRYYNALRYVPYFLMPTMLGIFILCTIVMDWVNRGRIRRNRMDSRLNDVWDFRIEYELESNGLLCLVVQTSCQDADVRDVAQVARHAYHKFCHTLNLHQHVFHSPDDDNLLVPEFVEDFSSSDWYGKFISRLFMDAEGSRIDGAEDGRLGAIGGLQYSRIFLRVFGFAGKPRVQSEDFYENIPEDIIKLEQELLLNSVEYQKSCEARDLRKIERAENRISGKRNLILSILSLLIAGFAIFSFHQDSGIIYPELSYFTDRILHFIANLFDYDLNGSWMIGVAFSLLLILLTLPIYLSEISIRFLSYARAMYSLWNCYSFGNCSGRVSQYNKSFPKSGTFIRLFFNHDDGGVKGDVHISRQDDEKGRFKRMLNYLYFAMFFLSGVFVINLYILELNCSLSTKLFYGPLGPDMKQSNVFDSILNTVCRLPAETKDYQYLLYLRKLSRQDMDKNDNNGKMPVVNMSVVGRQYKAEGVTDDGTWHSTIIDSSNTNAEYVGLKQVSGSLDIADSSGLNFLDLERIDGDLDLRGAQQVRLDNLKCVCGSILVRDTDVAGLDFTGEEWQRLKSHDGCQPGCVSSIAFPDSESEDPKGTEQASKEKAILLTKDGRISGSPSPYVVEKASVQARK